MKKIGDRIFSATGVWNVNEIDGKIFTETGEWILVQGAKLVAAVRERPTAAQIRLAKELRSRAAHWRKQMDRYEEET